MAIRAVVSRVDSGHGQATVAAGSLSQPKSDLSDFGRLMSRPNSGKPEFGWERGGVRGYKLSISPNPLTPTLSPAGRGSPAVPQSESVLTNESGDATVDCRTGWIGSATGWSNGKLLAAAAHTGAGGLRGDRRLAGVRAVGGAVLYRLHGGYWLRPRSSVAEEFRGGLFQLACGAAVYELADLCGRHGHRHARHGRPGGVGGGANRRAMRRALSCAGAAFVRDSGPPYRHGVDTGAQPQYRLGQHAHQIGLRPQGGAVQHLLHGRDDLGAVEPLLPARLFDAGAGAAGARRAHGGGRARVGRALLAGDAQDNATAVAAGDPVGGAAPVHAWHVVL